MLNVYHKERKLVEVNGWKVLVSNYKALGRFQFGSKHVE